MNNTDFMPQRGVHFDDYVATEYLDAQRGLEHVTFTLMYCPKNDNHDDDFIGIGYSGYATNAIKREDRGKMIQGIMYPANDFTKEDVERLFDKVKQEDGTVKYVPKKDISLNEVFIRVCYKQPGVSTPDKDNIKWVASTNSGEVITLHGERRRYVSKDAEA